MEKSRIQTATFNLINGIKYLYPKQVEDIKLIVCSDLKIEKTEENFAIIQKTIETYFTAQNTLSLSCLK
jgi:hypothetical protein